LEDLLVFRVSITVQRIVQVLNLLQGYIALTILVRAETWGYTPFFSLCVEPYQTANEVIKVILEEFLWELMMD